MITKSTLLNELIDDTYVILQPSKIAGIGVFALRPIPKGCRDMFSKPDPNEKWITLTNEEVLNLPDHARRLVENYCLFDVNQYYVPEKGFKVVDVSLFLNHSDTPNIISIDDGNYFETLRDIAEGEELLIDYGTIVDED
ncbi:MAG TPA: SET domain-containing protein [Ginsengibacter sp.]